MSRIVEVLDWLEADCRSRPNGIVGPTVSGCDGRVAFYSEYAFDENGRPSAWKRLLIAVTVDDSAVRVLHSDHAVTFPSKTNWLVNTVRCGAFGKVAA